MIWGLLRDMELEPESRLPTEPWMKYTGVSFLAALITWFKMPQRIRRETVRSAGMAMALFAFTIAALFAIAGFVWLVDWALTVESRNR